MNIMNNVNNKLYKIDEKEYINLGLTGLANLGNSCYLNSALQLLLSCEEFREFVSICNKDINKNKSRKN